MGRRNLLKKMESLQSNIALIYNNSPIFGVVYAPVIDTIYFNDEKNSFRIKNEKLEKLPIKQERDTFRHLMASKSHLNDRTKEFIESIPG